MPGAGHAHFQDWSAAVRSIDGCLEHKGMALPTWSIDWLARTKPEFCCSFIDELAKIMDTLAAGQNDKAQSTSNLRKAFPLRQRRDFFRRGPRSAHVESLPSREPRTRACTRGAGTGRAPGEPPPPQSQQPIPQQCLRTADSPAIDPIQKQNKQIR